MHGGVDALLDLQITLLQAIRTTGTKIIWTKGAAQVLFLEGILPYGAARVVDAGMYCARARVVVCVCVCV